MTPMARRIFILLICSLLLSCTKEEKALPTYTIDVIAGKEGTKALGLDGSGALKATWAEGEEVKVIKAGDGTLLGTLTAQSSGPNTKLSGTITGDISVGNTLSLDFLSSNYTSQDGTLSGNNTSIDKVCDYATAAVKVTAISGSSVTTEAATFKNMQAIVKFSLKHGDAVLPAEEMTVTVSGYTSGGPSSIKISVRPKTLTSELYVAIPCYYNGDQPLNFSLQVWSQGVLFSKDVASVKLYNGKYYHITVTL